MGFLYPSRVLFPILRLKRIKILESYDKFTPMNIFVKIQDRCQGERTRYKERGNRKEEREGRGQGVKGQGARQKVKKTNLLNILSDLFAIFFNLYF
jgi:hypothetical protein